MIATMAHGIGGMRSLLKGSHGPVFSGLPFGGRGLSFPVAQEKRHYGSSGPFLLFALVTVSANLCAQDILSWSSPQILWNKSFNVALDTSRILVSFCFSHAPYARC